MSTKIKGTVPPVDPNISSLSESIVQTEKAQTKPQTADSFSKNPSTVAYKAPPLIPSAKMFAGEVTLPSHLTDPFNPKNDRKFRRLLGAILGFGELEDCFIDLEEELEKESSAFSKITSDEGDSTDSSDSDDPEENAHN